MHGAFLSKMSQSHSLKFPSTTSTMRIDSPDIGGMPPRPMPRQRAQAVLRISASTFALLAMCLFAASISYTNANFTNLHGNGDWTDGLALAPSLLSLVLNSLFLVRGGLSANSTKPALRTGADFVVWGLAIPSIVYAVAGGMFWLWSDAIPEANGTVDCSFWYNGFSMQCAPVAYTIGHLQIAGSVFLALVCLSHLALCIAGVAELLSHRRARSNVAQSGFEMAFNDKDVESRPRTAA